MGLEGAPFKLRLGGVFSGTSESAKTLWFLLRKRMETKIPAQAELERGTLES
jgi:hypothetical protein